MITCHRSHLEARCTERGYTLDEVLPCVVSQQGDLWTIDVEHPAYPRVSRLPEPPTFPPTHGPGTELSRLLQRFGIDQNGSTRWSRLCVPRPRHAACRSWTSPGGC